MKKKLFIVFISVVILVGIFFIWRESVRNFTKEIKVTTQTETPDTLRVATFNIKSLNNGNSLDAFKADIMDLELDVIALQEVDESTFRSNEMDMMEELAQACDYPYYQFYETMWMVDGSYGIVILSRYPISQVSSKSLPNEFLKEPRVLANATIELGEHSITVYNTHLSFQERDVRWKQIDYINETIGNCSNTLLLGDFNTFIETDFFTLDGFTAINVANDPYITFQNFGNPDNMYDSKEFILLDAGVKISSFSDHNVFWCELKFHPENVKNKCKSESLF